MICLVGTLTLLCSIVYSYKTFKHFRHQQETKCSLPAKMMY